MDPVFEEKLYIENGDSLGNLLAQLGDILRIKPQHRPAFSVTARREGQAPSTLKLYVYGLTAVYILLEGEDENNFEWGDEWEIFGLLGGDGPEGDYFRALYNTRTRTGSLTVIECENPLSMLYRRH